MTLDVGARLRAIRQLHGLSQRELAKKADVTNSTISLIEQNKVSPGVASLKKVLDGIPITLAEFFAVNFALKKQYFYKKDELPDMGGSSFKMKLTGFNREKRALSILHEIYAPGADTGPEMLIHPGEEGGFVVRGEIEITVGNESEKLTTGDSFYFESSLPHRFHNVGEIECVMITAVTPPLV